MKKSDRFKFLSYQERFDAYVIPYYVFVTGPRSSFNKRLTKEFDKKAQEFEHYGEIEKAREFERLKMIAKRNFRLFTWALVLIGALIVILT